MSVNLFNHTLKEARRDALVGHYLATHDFSALPEGHAVTTADDLYEYLLLDTRISDSVTTSPLSEAISSLQLHIHRALEGYEGNLDRHVTPLLARDGFLYNWDRYNKRYSTWSAKEKLRFYAGNYIDPTLRVNKTKLFKALEDSLMQGKITHEQAFDGLNQYLVDFQHLADLVYISGAVDAKNNMMYFIGRDNEFPASYYWRSLTLRSADDGTLQPNYWTEWLPVDIGVGAARDDQVMAFYYKGKLHACWFTEEEHPVAEKKQGAASSETITFYHEGTMLQNGQWRLTDRRRADRPLPKMIGASRDTPARVPADPGKGDDVFLMNAVPGTPWPGECTQVMYVPHLNKVCFLSIFENQWHITSMALSRTPGDFPPFAAQTKTLTEMGMYRGSDVVGNDIRLYCEKGTVRLEYLYNSAARYGCRYIINPDNTLVTDSEASPIKYIGAHTTRQYVIEKNEIDDQKLSVRIRGGDRYHELTFECIQSTREFVITNKHPNADAYGDIARHKPDDHIENFHIPVGASVTVPLEIGKSVIHINVSPNSRIPVVALEFDFKLDVPITLVKKESFGFTDNINRTFTPPSGSLCPRFGFGFDSQDIISSRYPYYNLGHVLASGGAEDGLDLLYDYAQQDKTHVGGMAAFNGHNGQYLWEVFFHIPYLIASRFAAEQRFGEAEQWYKYIFNSAGYRDKDGHILTGDDGKTPRYWNCYPLQQASHWNALKEMPVSTDPDIIAMADPMHYKLAVFRHTLDLLIARGDAAYRLLERDTLTEAKMFYVQAQQLLGPRPDIRITNSWNNPSLGKAAGDIVPPQTRDTDAMPVTFAQWLRTGDNVGMGDGKFLPPYNDVLLAYHDRLDVRLYNLRHNLSLDGQPLSLPLYATPADPAELQRQQSGGDGIQDDIFPTASTRTGWRYPLLADRARTAAGLLTQFGNSLLAALERRDSEKLATLLQAQQVTVLKQQQGIARKNLDSLTAGLEALRISKVSAEMRQVHFSRLINEGLSVAETAGLTLRNTAMISNAAATGLTIAAGSLKAIPNIFGLAVGGHDISGPVQAVAHTLQMAAGLQLESAAISEITGSYQRRVQDWALQRELAGKEISQLASQIDSLNDQIAMQQKQIALTEMETAHAQAVYDMQSSRFTGQTLYNWMVGRLSALYYQLYDATIPVCLQARHALQRELGSDKGADLFRGAVWNDLWQGLLAGEGLSKELQKLDNVWLELSATGLEATRTVSLSVLRGEPDGSLSDVIRHLLAGKTDAHKGNGLLSLKGPIFSAVLDLHALKLADDYGPTGSGKKLFIKSIAVTLPTLMGPYQDIAATLSGDGETATLSHGIQDTGRFVVNLEDSRFQPFEGMDPAKKGKTLTLSIFNVKAAGDPSPNQRAIVENLSDIIFHIRYIMR